MRRSSKKLPSDSNQLAKAVVDLSVQDPTDPVKEYLASIGRRGGLKGGKTRAKRLSSEERSRIASLGGLAKSKRHQEKIVAKENSSHEN
jgi:hypothetical protein